MIACMIGNAIGLHTLPPFTIGLFIAPLQHEFGWSRTSISLGITIITIGTALSAPLVGVVVDRLGERLLIATGMLAMAGGYFALSLMAGSIAHFWAIMALMALFGAGCTAVTLSRIVVSLFDRHRGAALGITLIGTGLSGALAPIVLAPIIAVDGWRVGYQALSLVMIIGLPIVFGLLLFNGVGKAGQREARSPDAAVSIADVVRQPVFVRLLVPFVLVAVATGGVVVHFVPMLVDAGYDPSRAGKMASLVGLSLVTARLIVGVVLDYVSAPTVAIALTAASAIGFLGLVMSDEQFLLCAAIVTGMSLGAEVDLIAYLASRYFPPNQFSRAYSVLYAAFLISVAFSPLIYAELREWSGDYRPAFAGAAIFLAAGSICFARLRRGVAVAA